MDIRTDCIIHSIGGKLSDKCSSTLDVERIAQKAFTSNAKNGVVLHFHGGLVNYESGMEIATRLGNQYQQASTYPIFSVWESGLLESIGNNLKDILADPVFQELLKKVSEWVLKEGAGATVSRGAGQAIDVTQLREHFDGFLCGQLAEPPLKEQAWQAGVAKGTEPDLDELAQKIEAELEYDQVFQSTLAGLFVANGGVAPTGTRGEVIKPRLVSVVVDPSALQEMFPTASSGVSRGGFTWLKIALFVAKVVIASIKRFRSRRDHGAYTTVVEEVLRAAYAAKVGEVIWHQMKKDTADAFNDSSGAGEVVLQSWARLLAQGQPKPRVTLIGHSTGAIYIDHWIRRSAELAPSLVYDVVLLAPASRTEDFASLLESHGGLIENVRVFAMKDALEQQDHLASIIYPRSLLYFVSGVVEGDVDVPILGMQRYFAETDVFRADQFPAVQKLRQFLSGGNARAVWSVASAGPATSSTATSHGDFDDDAATIASVCTILSEGFNRST